MAHWREEPWQTALPALGTGGQQVAFHYASKQSLENPGRETDSTVIEPGLKGLNPHLPLKTAEQPKSGAAHHHSPCHLISSTRLYPYFLLDTRYCVASSAFHSVKGSFIPAPPPLGCCIEKERCQGFYEHSSAPCSPGFHCFLSCCGSWVVLG